MPLLWRFLLTHYLKTFALTVVVMSAVLLTTRFDDIAHFACMGSSATLLAKYILFQLPYLLPLAMIAAALIASYNVMRHLSHSSQLIALRAGGMSLCDILKPILICSLWIGLLNGILASEIATRTHLSNSTLRSELRNINPLILVTNRHLLQILGMSYEAKGPSRHGEYVEEGYVALPDARAGRLHLIAAKKMYTTADDFQAHNIAFVRSLPSKEEGFDQLMIENVAHSTSSQGLLLPLMQKKTGKIQPDHLHLALLFKHWQGLADHIAGDSGKGASQAKEYRKQQRRLASELFRRLSVALAVFTLTWTGCAFGICGPRNTPFWTKGAALVLPLLLLVGYFVAKGYEDRPVTAAVLYLTPHLLLGAAAYWRLRSIQRGAI